MSLFRRSFSFLSFRDFSCLMNWFFISSRDFKISLKDSCSIRWYFIPLPKNCLNSSPCWAMKLPDYVIILLSHAYISCCSWHLVILFSSLSCSTNLCIANIVEARAWLLSLMSFAHSVTSLYKIWYESTKSVILLQNTAEFEIIYDGTLPSGDTILSKFPFENFYFSAALMTFWKSLMSSFLSHSTKNGEDLNYSHLAIACINLVKYFSLFLINFSFSFFFLAGSGGTIWYGKFFKRIFLNR